MGHIITLSGNQDKIPECKSRAQTLIVVLNQVRGLVDVAKGALTEEEIILVYNEIINLTAELEDIEKSC